MIINGTAAERTILSAHSLSRLFGHRVVRNVHIDLETQMVKKILTSNFFPINDDGRLCENRTETCFYFQSEGYEFRAWALLVPRGLAVKWF